MQQKIVYRGLQINLSPNNYSENSEFIQRWQNIITEGSLKLLEYLLDWENKYFQIAGTKLEKEIAEIQLFRNSPDFNKLELRLQCQIKLFQSEIKERKHKKYIRDKRDFESGQIYSEKICETIFQKTRIHRYIRIRPV